MQFYDCELYYLTINGFRYQYIDEGQGEPIILLHGNPSWSFMCRTLINPLRPDYRVIAPDHVGCGLSDKPESKKPMALASHSGASSRKTGVILVSMMCPGK
jgi:haloalkane dehalogenase